ncbi:MAG: hypothetical protein ABIO76_05020, partial [Ginsengibacter sp.]
EYFCNGISNYLRSSFDEAVTAFQHVLDLNPTDHTAKHFFNNATRYLKDGTPANWMGIEKMSNK